MTQRIVFTFLCILLPFSQLSAQLVPLPQKVGQSIEHNYWDGRVVFKIKEAYKQFCTGPEIEIPGFDQIRQNIQGRKVSRMFPHINPPESAYNSHGQKMADLSRIYLLEFPKENLPIEYVLGQLQQHPAIEYAEPWYLYDLMYIPNDPFADTVSNGFGLWYLKPMQAYEAYDLQRNDSSVVVGIVDSGTSYEHPELQANLFFNVDDTIDGLDNDQDGYIDNYRGWDFGGDTLGSLGDNDATTIFPWHGIGVAGAVAATADNNLGTAGVGFNCSYLPIKAAPNDDVEIIYYGYQGILYAVEQGCQIVNCSWGGTVASRFGEDVVNYATINREACVIAACGNSGTDVAFYPASYDRVLSVANSGRGDTICCFSTYNYAVNLHAPGLDIFSLRDHDKYLQWVGTSVSAPVTAGAVALTISQFPNLSPYQAGQRVRVTTDDTYGINSGFIDKIGTGRVNMYRALTDPAIPSVRQIGIETYDLDRDQLYAPGDTLILTADFRNFLEATEALEIELVVPPTQVSFVEILNDPFEVGQLEEMESIRASEYFVLKLKTAIPPNFTIHLKFNYTDENLSYYDYEYIRVGVNETWLNVTENAFHTTVTSEGNFGFNDFFRFQQGLGALHESSRNYLAEGGFLIGNSSLLVLDRIRNQVQNFRDDDFHIASTILRTKNPYLSDFHSHAVFGDNPAPAPLHVLIDQQTFAWQNPPYEDFIIQFYQIENTQGSVIDNLYAGLFADWDIFYQNRNFNSGSFDSQEKLAYTWDATGNIETYFGMQLLSSGPFLSKTLTNPILADFTNGAKFSGLTQVPDSTNSTGGLNGGLDIMQYVSTGPFSIAAGATDTLAFALIAGEGLEDLKANAAAARNAYDCFVLQNGPVLPFSVSATSVTPMDTLQFGDNNPDAISWSWDFGDGNSSSLSNPMHSYDSHGRYTVSLTVSDSNCTFRSSQEIQVGFNTAIDWTADPAMVVYPNPFEDHLVIRWEHAYQGEIELSLIDVLGRTLWEGTLEKRGSLFEQGLELDQLPSGLYELRLKAGDYTGVRLVQRQN